MVSKHPTSQVLDIDVTSVDRLIADGTLPSIRLKRRVLIPRQALLDLLRVPRIPAA